MSYFSNFNVKGLLMDVASFVAIDYAVERDFGKVKTDAIDFAGSDAAYQMIVGSWLEPLMSNKLPGGTLAIKTLGVTAGLYVAETIRGKSFMENIKDVKGLVTKAAKVGGSLLASDYLAAKM